MEATFANELDAVVYKNLFIQHLSFSFHGDQKLVDQMRAHRSALVAELGERSGSVVMRHSEGWRVVKVDDGLPREDVLVALNKHELRAVLD